MKQFICTAAAIIFSSLTQTAIAVSVPMQLDKQHWKVLEYNNIPANRVSQVDHGLKVQVNGSASPLIYVFDKPQAISQVTVTGSTNGLPGIPQGLKQGDKGADDFPFRLGLVLEGDKTLNFAQKLIATQWVKILFDLAPPDTGIDHIMFLNLANRSLEQGFDTHRKHPDGKGLFTETVVALVSEDEKFDFSYTLPMPVKVLALWISSDGDDTASEYMITINSISYD